MQRLMLSPITPNGTIGPFPRNQPPLAQAFPGPVQVIFPNGRHASAPRSQESRYQITPATAGHQIPQGLTPI